MSRASNPADTAARPTRLAQMVQTTPTELWSDSCEVTSLAEAIAQGASGATSNPVIVKAAIEQDRPRWDAELRRLAVARPRASETELAWALVDQAVVEAAALLAPVFEASQGRRGRLCVQVNPQYYRDAQAMVEQATHFHSLAPNVAVKVPALPAGLEAIEALTARGVVINATVSYSVPQALAVAEAVERGVARAEAGVELERVTPWVTIMVGRIDDHLRDEWDRLRPPLDRAQIRWASIAIMKRAYGLFQTRGYRAKLLAAAMRGTYHWSEFIGGDLVVTIPPKWQHRFNASDVDVLPRIADRVDPAVVADLAKHLPDFVRAYEPAGMTAEEFTSFGACVKTLRQFLGGYQELLALVRDVMLPLEASPPELPRTG